MNREAYKEKFRVEWPKLEEIHSFQERAEKRVRGFQVPHPQRRRIAGNCKRRMVVKVVFLVRV